MLNETLRKHTKAAAAKPAGVRVQPSALIVNALKAVNDALASLDKRLAAIEAARK